jgi:hypothetical protein
MPGSRFASCAILTGGLRPTIANVHSGLLRRMRGKTSSMNHVTPSTFGSQSMDPMNTRSATRGVEGGGAKYSRLTPVGIWDTCLTPNIERICSASAADTATM